MIISWEGHKPLRVESAYVFALRVAIGASLPRVGALLRGIGQRVRVVYCELDRSIDSSDFVDFCIRDLEWWCCCRWTGRHEGCKQAEQNEGEGEHGSGNDCRALLIQRKIECTLV